LCFIAHILQRENNKTVWIHGISEIFHLKSPAIPQTIAKN